jgi:hypothetical protein
MSSARRLMRRAEAIRRDMEGMDNMEGTWITFKVGPRCPGLEGGHDKVA